MEQLEQLEQLEQFFAVHVEKQYFFFVIEINKGPTLPTVPTVPNCLKINQITHKYLWTHSPIFMGKGHDTKKRLTKH